MVKSVVYGLKQSITCGVCLEVFTDPVSLSECHHSFCRECLQKSLQIKSNCPICVTKASLSKIISNAYLIPLITSLSNLIDLYEQQESKERLINPKQNQPFSFLSHLNCSINKNEMNDITPFPLFSVGQIIEVVSRTWAGINKLGGTARILSINQNGLSYDIKYVLTSTREKDVQATFIKPLEEFTKEKRRRISDSTPMINSSSYLLQKNDKSQRLPFDSNHDKVSSFSLQGQSKNSNISYDIKTCRRAMVLLTSCLSETDLVNVDNFIEKFNILNYPVDHVLNFDLLQVQNIGKPSVLVTHLIVPTDKNGVFEQRTMKYLQALIIGAWIVDINWILQSLVYGHVLEEIHFEVTSCCKAVIPRAPARARSHLHKQSVNKSQDPSKPDVRNGLFNQFIVLVYGQYPMPHPPKSQLTDLLLRGGAIVCCNVKDLAESLVQQSNTKIVSSKEVKSKYKSKSYRTSSTHHVVICLNEEDRNGFMIELRNCIEVKNDHKSQECIIKFEEIMRLLHILDPDWILNNVTNYSLDNF